MDTASLKSIEMSRKMVDDQISADFVECHHPGVIGAVSSWASIFQRVFNPTLKQYKDYGGRGIQVCERWLYVENFLADMGPRPDKKSLDRIDFNGNYEPSNCRWATDLEQGRNTRRVVWVDFNGERMTQTDAAARLGLCESTLSRRRTGGRRQLLAAKGFIGNKLNRDQAEEIRRYRKYGMPLKTLADAFGVSAQTVSQICRGEIWQ